MFGITYLKSKLGGDKEVPASEQFYSPLRIALHSTINVSMIDWFGAISELNKSVIMPKGSMSILAIGTTEESSNKIFNIYMMDEKQEEFSLQLFCTPNDRGEGMEVREATLFREVRNVSPQSEDDWTVELHEVGNPTIKLDNHEYKRVWSDDYVGKLDMVEFEEDVIRPTEELHYTNNYVLYGRELETPTTQTELLLIGVEESEDSAEMVHRIGLVVPQSAIKVL